MNRSNTAVRDMPVTHRLRHAKQFGRQTNELIGLARGMLADGVLNQGEAEYLLKWLEERPGALDVWPFDVLFQRLSESLADDHLDGDEKAELMRLLVDLTGGGSLSGEADTTASLQSSSLPLNDPPPIIEFEGRTFVVTSTFVSGSRDEVKADTAIRGGRVAGAVSRKTDYVVLGQQVSDQWKYSNYGGKLEKAMMLRDDGHPIASPSSARNTGSRH